MSSLIFFSFLIFLFVLNIPDVEGQSSNSIKLLPVDDAFIFAPSSLDSELREANTGDLPYLKMWLVDADDTRLGTYGFLKFNVPELVPEKIVNATLYMKPFFIYKNTESIEFVVTKIDDNFWYENELTYANKPRINYDRPLPSSLISEQDEWYHWDVKTYTRKSVGDDLSIVLNFRTNPPAPFEQVVSFYSKEAEDPENTPYLIIEYSEPLSLKNQDGGGCLIATATYGSELAPQVQQLRELRDNSLLQTETGSAFMKSFNSIYYSFSPGIADLERESPIFKEIVKLTITPLLTSLSILNHVDINSEESVLSYGISLILLNFVIYFVAPVMLFFSIKNKKII